MSKPLLKVSLSLIQILKKNFWLIVAVCFFAQSLTAFIPEDPIPEIPVNGQGGPVLKTYPVGGGGFALFTYDMGDDRDRMQVLINDSMVLDTGLVEGKGQLGLIIPSGETDNTLTVMVNADGESKPDSKWQYKIHMNPSIDSREMLDILNDTKDRLDSLHADPVDTATGAQVMRHNLFNLRGAQPWAFSIDYHSFLTHNGPLGRGWSHNYETRLEPIDQDQIKIHWNKKRFNRFSLRNKKDKNKKEKQTEVYQALEPAARFYQLQPNTDNTYTLTDRRNKTKWQFNSNGQLTTIQNAAGQVLSLSYSPSNQLTTIQEPISGRQLDFTYNKYGKITKIKELGTGRSVNFAYNNSDLLTNVVLANANILAYTYNEMGQILSGTDNQGPLFLNTYDKEGRIIAQDDSRAETPLTRFTYLPKRLKKKELKNLFKTENTESAIENLISQTQVNSDQVLLRRKRKRLEQTTIVLDRTKQIHLYHHNDKFQLLSYTDPENRVTRHHYDRAGNRRLTIYPGHRRVRYSYNANNQMTKIQPPGLNPLKIEYDDKNNLISASAEKKHTHTFQYNDASRFTQYTDPLGKTYQLTYTSDGLLQQITKPSGGTIIYTYEKGRPSQIKDLTDNLWNLTYDSAGRLTTLSDAEGNKNTYTYDERDHITARIDPLGNKTIYQYDLRGNVIQITNPKGTVTTFTYSLHNKLTSITDAQDQTTTFTYDNEDRLLSATDALGNVTRYKYDKAGRRIATITPLGNRYTHHYDKTGNLIETIDPLKNSSYKLSYNRQNQPSRIETAQRKQKIHYDKQGRPIFQQQGKQANRYDYDPLNRLTQTKTSAKQSAQQTFDADGNLNSFTGPNANTTTLERDKAGRLTVLKTPTGQTTTYTYNKRNLLETVISPANQKTTLVYDPAGRIDTLAEDDGDTTYTYDKVGQLLTVTKDGKTITRQYDSLGRLTQFTDTQGNTLNYAYDAIGRLTELTYPDGKTVAYSYDANSRLTTVTDWAGRVTKYIYDESGKLIETQRPNGTKESRTYGKGDKVGVLIQLTDTSGSQTLLDYHYQYNSNGQLTEQKGEPELPDYELTTPIEMSYNADNWLITYNGQTLNYDPNGNLLNGPSEAYAYDNKNRLIEAGDLTYTYDLENRRIAVESPQGITHLVHNPNALLSQLLVRKTPDGKTTYYVYGLGLLYQETEDQASYYHYDQQGNTLLLTDQTGQITDEYAYGPYGELIKREGIADIPFLYNSRYGVMTDSNGLLHMRARYYSPELKRFLNQDILLGGIDNPLSLNRFTYVNGDPINYIDPSGLIPYPNLPDLNPLDDISEWVGDQIDFIDWGDVAKGSVTTGGAGAGAGAATGLLGGPFAEVTVPTGAAVGGVGGFLTGGAESILSQTWDHIFGEDDDSSDGGEESSK